MKFGIDPNKILKLGIFRALLGLKISFRLYILLFLPAIPIGWESFIIIRQIYTEMHLTARKEDGMRYLLYLNQLLRYAQLHREQSATYLANRNPKFLTDMNESRERILTLIPSITEVDAKYDSEMDSKKIWLKTRDSLMGSVVTGKENIDPQLLYERQTGSINGIIGQIRYILAVSNLLLDPDSLTYHLVYAGLKDLPELMEQYSQSRALSSRAAADGKISREERDRLFNFFSRSNLMIEDISYNINTIYNMDRSIRYIIEPNYKKLLSKTHTYEGDLKQNILNAGKITTGEEQIFDSATQAIESMYQFQTMIYNSLNYLYTKRMASLKRDVYISIVITLIIFVVTLLFALIIVSSISSPLEVAIGMAEEISSGDLRKKIKTYGKDEIARFLSALNTMSSNLSGMITGIKSTARDTTRSAVRITFSSEKFTSVAQQQASAAQDATSAMEQMAASAEGIVTSIEQSTISMEEIKKSLHMLMNSIEDEARQMEDLTGIAQSAADRAQGSEELIQTAMIAMEKIQESTNKITEFTGIISEISDQTNLLSLNAAIEAARAGESGRGFAVVAQEITKLAERTLTSVKEVKSIIGETLATVQSGTGQVKTAAGNLGEIIQDVQRIDSYTSQIMERIRNQTENARIITNNSEALSDVTRNIQVSVQEQKKATVEIEGTMSSLSQAAQSVTLNAKELSDLAGEMQHSSENMLKMVERFQI